MKIKAHFVILPNVFKSDDGFIGEYDQSAIQWISQSIIKAIVSVHHNFRVQFDVVELPSNWHAVDSVIDAQCKSKRQWLDFSIFPDAPFCDQCRDEEARLSSILDVYEIIRIEYHYGVISCNIARPGSLRTLGMSVYADDELIITDSGHTHFLLDEIQDSERVGWPKIHLIGFDLARSWLGQFNIDTKTHGETRVEKAIALLSNVLKGTMSEEARLMWYSAGLEVFYCDSSEGVKRQLFEKCQAFLGPIAQYKKEIRSVYDVRSSLFHGGMSYPYEYRCDEIDYDNRYTNDIRNSVSIMARMFIGTFQKMILDSRSTLEFKYVLA